MKFVSTPVKGMNDFLPSDMRLRQHVQGMIRESYRTYGFDEIETPVMEHIENLSGKVGGEFVKVTFVGEIGSEAKVTGRLFREERVAEKCTVERIHSVERVRDSQPIISCHSKASNN